jgi:hypothetical protein
MGQTVHLSEYLRVPFSINPNTNHSTVEKFAIMKRHNGVFEVGVWDSTLSKYDTKSYSDCNSKTLTETIEKLNLKVGV